MVQCSYVFEVSLMALMIVYILNSIVPTVGWAVTVHLSSTPATYSRVEYSRSSLFTELYSQCVVVGLTGRIRSWYSRLSYVPRERQRQPRWTQSCRRVGAVVRRRRVPVPGDARWRRCSTRRHRSTLCPRSVSVRCTRLLLDDTRERCYKCATPRPCRPRPRPRCVRWGPSSPKRGTAAPQIFGPCLLWLNGWMDQDATWYRRRPRPRRHCVRRRPRSSPRKGAQQPPISRPTLLWHGHPSQQLLSSYWEHKIN